VRAASGASMSAEADVPQADVYIDANILIYIVEGNKALAPELTRIIAALDAGVLRAVSSELTLAEVLIGPLRTNDLALSAAYKAVLTSGRSLQSLPVSGAVLERSAAIRCNSITSLPDAIHLATAELAGCRYFLTEDRQLRVRPPLLAVGPVALDALLVEWHLS
jgi:predicted nucleic acid-binding protein